MTDRSAFVGGRRRRGQGGQSLIEVMIAIVLAGMVFLTVAGAMLTVSKATSLNETVQAIDTGLVSYGEILQTQVEYAPCPNAPGAANIVEAYQNGYVSSVTGAFVNGADQYIYGGTGADARWRRPPKISVRVMSVQSWNTSTNDWNSACSVPDSGVQLVTYQVIGCPTPNVSNTPNCAGGKIRTGQVVKRRSGPS